MAKSLEESLAGLMESMEEASHRRKLQMCALPPDTPIDAPYKAMRMVQDTPGLKVVPCRKCNQPRFSGYECPECGDKWFDMKLAGMS